MPDAINYTQARNELAATMDKVCEAHEPVIITRQKSEPVVMLSLEDYNSLVETAYLLQSPANARRLYESVQRAKSGQVQERGLIED